MWGGSRVVARNGNDCRPPPGRTYLAIGQDLFSVEEYLREQYNYSLHQYLQFSNRSRFSRKRERSLPKLTDALPSAFMVYTDLQTLRGLNEPTDYGSGVEFADGLLQLSQSRQVNLQIGLWLNGTQGCRDVLEARLEKQLGELYYYLSRCRAAKVFLRVGYEFDNPSFGYNDSDVYQRAFRRLALGCRSHSRACREKVVFVWHSWAASFENSEDLQSYYPGDDVVDWIGVSLFSQLYTPFTSVTPPLGNRETVETVLQWAQQRRKPVMIAESTPFGGIPSLNDPWNDWFEPVLQLIEQYDVSMWSYINCDWESQPMWRNVGFGDTRLDRDETVMKLWQQRVLMNSRFASPIQSVESLLEHPLRPNFSIYSATLLSEIIDSRKHIRSVLSPWHVFPLTLIVMVAVCFRVWCSLLRTRSGGHHYLVDESEEGDGDTPIFEQKRTSYGTLAQ